MFWLLARSLVFLLFAGARLRLVHSFSLASPKKSIRPNNSPLSLSTKTNYEPDTNTYSLAQRLKAIFASATLGTIILTSPISIHLNDQQYSISLNPSIANAYLTENQQLISEVWSTVSSQYFDQSFNGLGMEGWKSVEQKALKAVEDTGPDDEQVVNEAIKTMLAVLNDPFTRYLPREKYETLTTYATGATMGGGGVGVQLLEDARSKNVLIMGLSDGAPAAKAGLQIGDAIVKINGESMESVSADVVAVACRGEIGEKLELDIIRSGADGKLTSQHVSLVRAKIIQNPVTVTTFTSETGKKIGLLRIPSFSTETVTQLVDGLRSVNTEKVDAIAIDLRGNVGGYMPAGVDAASLFLPARSKIIAEVGKSGTPKSYEADGIGADTSTPLYILLDKRTASASEIFAAALQDNRRATIVGMSNSFGKGRIQNVKPLENGSGVAVTRARYVTPLGKDIHGVGIAPDKTSSRCEATDSAKTCLADIAKL